MPSAARNRQKYSDSPSSQLQGEVGVGGKEKGVAACELMNECPLFILWQDGMWYPQSKPSPTAFQCLRRLNEDVIFIPKDHAFHPLHIFDRRGQNAIL